MFHRFDHRAGHHLLLIALWAVLCLPNLGGPSLWDIDEGNNSECFREMLACGNYIIPTFNYQLREDKPVLLYWLQMSSARLFGVNEWASRFPSALAALLAVLTLYELGRQTFGKRAGLLAGVVLITSFSLLGAAHFANPDALLLAFTSLGLTLFWHDYRTGGRGWLMGAGIASGLAVLAKGPVGLVLPSAVILLFLLWERKLGYLLDWRVPGMALAFIVVAAPWYIWVGLETKGAWLTGFWKNHHVKRMRTPMESHAGPLFYYLLVLLAGLLPWSIFLGPTITHTIRRLRSREPGEEMERSAVRFLVVWLAVYFVFFSLVQTKLPNYILPAYPAVALLVGYFLMRWQRGDIALSPWLIRAGLACLALLGVGTVVGLLAAGGWVPLSLLRGRAFPGAAAWAWLGAAPIVGAAVAWRYFERGSRTGLITAISCAAVVFSAPLVGWGLEAMEPHKAARPLAEALPEDQTRRDVRIATWSWFQPSVVFYCQREVVRCQKEDEALSFLQGQLPSFLFVPENSWQEMQKRLPAKVRVLARHHDVYSGRTIVLVTNE